MYKQNSEFMSIQKKLVGAIAMVLVACIMVVSSSYAWFTLSTAPEVTGIQTSVGSNGNLEIALRGELPLTEIPNSVGATFPNANNAWGNLVDLSYNNMYGLDKIVLAPARLNATKDINNTVSIDVSVVLDNAAAAGYAVYDPDATGEGANDDAYYVPNDAKPDNKYPIKKIEADQPEAGKTTITYTTETPAYMLNATGFLQTPEYGTDGRVSAINPNTVNGPYDTTKLAFAAKDGVYGVRAVGVTSKISPAALALRNAKNAVNSAISDAKNGATGSLKNDSVKLASILINNKLTGTQEFTEVEDTNVKNAIANLNEVADLLEDALKQAVVAVAVSQYPTDTFAVSNVTLTDTTITVKLGETEKTLDWTGTGMAAYKAEILRAYKNLVNPIRSSLTAAENAYNNVTHNAPTYSQLTAVMTSLLKVENFEVSKDGHTYTVDQLMALGEIEAGLIMAGEPTINIKSGIYHDIALFTGNYNATAALVVNAPSYGLNNKELKVYMNTTAAEPVAENDAPAGYYLPALLTCMANLSASEDGASELITNTYGYVLDFAFRTNAVGSNLLLQTAGISRVGNDETAAVQGAGSYMKFKPNVSNFTYMQALNLMGSIRVVFVNDTNTIFGVAALDTELVALGDTNKDGVVDTGETWVDFDENTHNFYVEKTEGATTKRYAAALENGSVDADGYIQADLYLMNYSVSNEGKLTLDGKASTNVITDLQQNQAKAISTLVYLDGDTVENADVAISGNSMSGFMNLQFASSAELDPMDYTFTEPQLAAPANVALSAEGVLTFDAVENATSYEIYVKGTATNKTVTSGTNITTALNGYDLTGFTGQQVDITLVAKADGYRASQPSNVVTYTVP